MTEFVRYECVDAIATVTIARPAALNALDHATKVALRQALTRAAGDADVRAVVLTGAGRAFCVGQDLRQHREQLARSPQAALGTVAEHYNPLIMALTTMRKPVIAAVNGVAAGAGAALAFACDFRVLAETATVNLAFAGIGLGADSGASWTLPRLVGHARATELLMLSETISAARALELGIANRVVPAEDVATAASELARRLAAGPTVAFAAIKEALVCSATLPIARALGKESALQLRAGKSADHREAVDAFLDKRQPRFTGR
ncbi:enoyl-CoA hydratase/isomerase family protein [Embleya hyalina]|uniref:Enoyl-CoA hydratase n=1 Tax=Embleya hyalina TaxID=516124 RepID=A0A401YEC5_9ACTN|nr:enoyl-CoA hydratase-related protein [Embleya hyalina]GCD92954.1 enoyl-CoA hydratase [Embleya hyalina]